ncbi:MAG: uracil phosphoribosyltransferase, partial [Cytophagaceae bacterium]|nr:uracil phosphoribosyltransferase [Cytophagaceae bacterium]
ELMAYEISKTLAYHKTEVPTPLGIAKTALISDQVVLATILRAGLPFHQGFLNYFDKAETAFIAAYRASETINSTVEIKMEYLASPSLEGKVLIIIDPMLATGKSLLLTYQTLLKHGMPSSVHIASVIASKPGVSYLKDNIQNFNLWVGALDEELNDKAYIIPGLGDAGDLSFGGKL